MNITHEHNQAFFNSVSDFFQSFTRSTISHMHGVDQWRLCTSMVVAILIYSPKSFILWYWIQKHTTITPNADSITAAIHIEIAIATTKVDTSAIKKKK